MYVVVCYDISDDRRRARLGRILECEGARLQESVYEVQVSEKAWRALRRRLESLVKRETDKLLWYPLCSRCLRARGGKGGLAGVVERLYYVL